MNLSNWCTSNPLSHNDNLTILSKKAVENIVENGTIVDFQHFLLSPQCFLHHKENLHHLNHNETVICNCFNPFPNKPRFLLVFSTSLLKTLWEKEKLLVTSNFSILPQCFLPVWRTFCYFNQIWNCRLQTLSVRKSLKFFVWEKVRIGHS